VRHSDTVPVLLRELGQQLAALRREAGLTQENLAALARFSRSTVSVAEIGRQPHARDFWAACDKALDSGGVLTAGFDQIDAVREAEERAAACAAQEDASRMAKPSKSSPSTPDGTPTLPMPPGATTDVGEQAAGQELARLTAQLTEREMHVLAALCDLKAPQQASAATPTAGQIAADLSVAVGTVRAHLLHLYWKLDVPDGPERRARLARKVVALGLAGQGALPAGRLPQLREDQSP